MSLFSPFRFTVLFVALGSLLAAAESALNEEFFPFNARTTSEVFIGEGAAALPPGTPFVLIRVEGDIAVADVSRRGVFRVPVAATDIAELTRAAMDADADQRPDMSRMSSFIGNKLIGGDSNWQNPVQLTLANRFRTWIFLYADADSPATANAVRSAEAFYAGLDEASRETTALVFMEINGSKAGIQAVADAHKPSFQTMPGYLSKGYTTSFAHLDATRTTPHFVAVNAAGRILATHTGSAAGEDFWATCRLTR